MTEQITAPLASSNRDCTPSLVLAALDSALAVAEFAADGSVLRANGNYRAIFGYCETAFRQRDHRTLCGQEELHRRLWSGLQKGQPASGLYPYLGADGRQLWLQASYAPVLDAAGALERIVQFATDVSLQIEHERAERERTRLLALSADKSGSALCLTDGDGRLIYVNDALTRLLGFRAVDLLGRHATVLLSGSAARPESLADLPVRLRTGETCHLERLFRDHAGQPRWCSLTIAPVLDETGRLSHAVGTLTDISDRLMHQVQQKALEAMAQDVPLGEVMALICREMERLAPEVVATIVRVDEAGRLHSLAAPSLPDSYSQGLEGMEIGPAAGSCGTAAYHGRPVLVRDIACDPLWDACRNLVLPLGLRACWSSPILDGDGRAIASFAFYYREPHGPSAFHQRLVDLSIHLCSLALQRESSRSRIHQLAYYDSLTGLPNRSMLLTQAGQALANAQRTSTPLSVLFIDLDRFKQINDSLGHPAGDALLRIVAQRLRCQTRASDLIGRLAGDEFVVVLTECDGKQAAATVERIQTLLSNPTQIGGAILTPTASIGVSQFPENGTDMETLLRHADLAMYEAKRNGNGHFCFFSEEMNRLAHERLTLEAALRDALRRGQLQLHYQPLVDLRSGRLYGIEALARWQHPQFGELSPRRFIVLAEECGLIEELDDWALDEACRQVADWRRRGLKVPPLSVNLSPCSLHDAGLPERIAVTLERHGLTPADLLLEIGESVLLDSDPVPLLTLQALRAQGIGLVLDDFGSGYYSISHLPALKINALKLDKRFIQDLENDKIAHALARSALRFGDSLKLDIIAKGVESQAQRQLLEQQGYQLSQGNLFSRPLPADQLEPWLEKAPQTAGE